MGALVHIMLPLNMETGRTNPLKYADTGIRETLRAMERSGAKHDRITAKIAGGAQMFEVRGNSLGNIGQRNIESVHLTLRREGIRLLKEDVGGTVARTLLFDVSTGLACVRSYEKPELIL
jgi:chemotaxis protein CheD